MNEEQSVVLGTLQIHWTPLLPSLDLSVEKMMKTGKVKDEAINGYSLENTYLGVLNNRLRDILSV